MIPSNRVQFYRTLFSFVKGHVKQRLETFEKLWPMIYNDKHPAFNLRQLFADNHSEIFEAVSEDIIGWGSFPSHFNTPSFDSPQLAHLADVPEQFYINAWQMEDDRLSIFIVYRADGIVNCQYKDRSVDGHFSGRVTFDIQVNIILEPSSGEVEEFEIGDLCQRLWPEWPEPASEQNDPEEQS